MMLLSAIPLDVCLSQPARSATPAFMSRRELAAGFGTRREILPYSMLEPRAAFSFPARRVELGRYRYAKKIADCSVAKYFLDYCTQWTRYFYYQLPS